MRIVSILLAGTISLLCVQGEGKAAGSGYTEHEIGLEVPTRHGNKKLPPGVYWGVVHEDWPFKTPYLYLLEDFPTKSNDVINRYVLKFETICTCLLYTSPSPRDA